jgi:hypothetical protein
MILNDQRQYPISDPPFAAAKKVLDIDTAYEMKGRLAQIDANRMYLHHDDPFCKKLPLRSPARTGESSGGLSH